MGYIARAQLASAVSNAGGLGIIETSSGELDVVRGEIRRMRDLTDRPFGVNIAQLLVRDSCSVSELPVHPAFKQAILDAAETDTVMLNRRHRPCIRTLALPRARTLEHAEQNVFGELGSVQQLYFGGDMGASIAISGQVAGRIEQVLPVAQIISEMVAGFRACSVRLAQAASS